MSSSGSGRRSEPDTSDRGHPLVRPFQDRRDREQVCALWRQVFDYQDERNRPELSLDRKLGWDGSLLLVAVEAGRVIGSVMGGYDGHRGWVYSLAVLPGARGRGVGSELMRALECALEETGCLKINLQVEGGNAGVVEFYRKRGYRVEDRISMGRELTRNLAR